MLNPDQFILRECHIIPGPVGFHHNITGRIIDNLDDLSFPIGNLVAAGPTIFIQHFYSIANVKFSHYYLLDLVSGKARGCVPVVY